MITTALMSLCLLPAAPADVEKAAEKKAPVELLLLDFKSPEADAQAARVLQNVTAAELSEQEGLLMNTQADLKRLVELETEKMVLDCNAEACLAEVAGALGVRYVMFGELGRLGNTAALSVTLFDAEKARPLLRRTLRGADVLALEPQLKPMVVDALAELGFAPAAREAPASAPLEISPGLIIAGAGGAAAVGLGITALVADASLDDASADKAGRDLAYFGGIAALAGAAAAVVVAGVGVGLMVME